MAWCMPKGRGPHQAPRRYIDLGTSVARRGVDRRAQVVDQTAGGGGRGGEAESSQWPARPSFPCFRECSYPSLTGQGGQGISAAQGNQHPRPTDRRVRTTQSVPLLPGLGRATGSRYRSGAGSLGTFASASQLASRPLHCVALRCCSKGYVNLVALVADLQVLVDAVLVDVGDDGHVRHTGLGAAACNRVRIQLVIRPYGRSPDAARGNQQGKITGSPSRES